MYPFTSSVNVWRVLSFVAFLTACLLSQHTNAQTETPPPTPTRLAHRLLSGYTLNTDAPVNKGKPTLFVFEQSGTFEQVFQPTTAKRSSAPNFNKEMVVGVVLPPTNKPPKLSISRVFVLDSALTVRYIKQADTSKTETTQTTMSQPMLLLAIPKPTVLSTRLVENGRLVQTLRRRENVD